LPVAPY